MKTWGVLWAGMASLTLAVPFVNAESPDFIAFESASVRPLALSPDGNTLYATNTPDNTVEAYTIDAGGGLVHAGSIPVGMEPVALAADGNRLYVVNHLSDSVSVVDTTLTPPRVVRTLLVGDEPRDVVIAQDRLFVTTAHLGQQRSDASLAGVPGAGDPLIHTPSVPRADVWVFDTADTGSGFGGTPLKIVELFGDTPRGLAVSPDGATVYAAVLNSGNQTTAVHESVLCYGFEDTPQGFFMGTFGPRAGDEPCVAGNMSPGLVSDSPNGLPNKQLPMGRPLPSTNADGDSQPWTSLLVQFDNATGTWKDTRGLNFSNGIRFFLPDHDVFAIDVETLDQADDYEHVGTTLFNVAVNPQNGNVYVSNTDANNMTRFEGPGVFGGSTVQGQIALSRITIINPADGSVRPRHLNRHIDYSVLKAPAGVKTHSVSTPLQMQFSPDGTRLYVAALGSDKVAVYDTADLENDALWDGADQEFDPTLVSAGHLSVPGGPQGVLLDPTRGGDNGQLYVLTRFDNSVKTVNVDTGLTTQTVTMPNPEPADVQAGRFMLYDANRTSSNGESACAACHVFGDTDHMAWNLGNPDEANTDNINPFPQENLVWLGCDLIGDFEPSCLFARQTLNGTGDARVFASMKGPMATQTMRGMSTHGHMHWRGDRVNGYFGSDVDPNLDGDGNPDTRDFEALDERLSFKNFIVAFDGLQGLDVDLPESVDSLDKSPEVLALEADMEKFTDFMLAVQLPPNPIRGLDNSLSPSAQIGRNFFSGPRRGDGLGYDTNRNGPEPDGARCIECHAHDNAKGFYGTDGRANTGGEAQIMKPPHFRNLYTRVGMFGLPNRAFFLPSPTDAHQGDQVRGFGFLHDGATDTLYNFLGGAVFEDGTTNCTDVGLDPEFGCDFNFGNVGLPDDQTRQGLVDYMMEFDSDLAPVVGQQITLAEGANAAMQSRLDLLETRAGSAFVSKTLGGNVTECDLVARGVIANEARGYLYEPVSDTYVADRAAEPAVDAAALRALAQSPGNALTFTCVPPGSGQRVGLDRDRDGILNGDEVALADADQDGVPDGADNCTQVANALQIDSNGDGIGNACDADLDGNCAVDFSDLGLFKSVFLTADANADFNGDGVVNFGDLGIMKQSFFLPPGPSGLPNACSGD
ncbi:MAG: beta-propeller fold lactonase family protein [Pseudomonadota bacterium]